MKITEVKSKQVINCKTQAEDERICKLMHDAGLKRIDGVSFLKETRWNLYEENTCYNPTEGTFSYIRFYKSEGYEVLDSTLITAEPDFKWGDDVEVSDYENRWRKERFVGMNPVDGRFVTVNEDGCEASWKLCRPLNPRKAEIEKQMAELQAKMAEFQSELDKINNGQ